MLRNRLTKYVIVLLIAGACIVGAATVPAAFAAGEDETAAAAFDPENITLNTRLEYGGGVFTAEICSLDGELSGEYAADRVQIVDPETGALIREYYHIFDNRADMAVSLFTEDGLAVECVEDPAAGLITLYKFSGAEGGFAVVGTESVSLGDGERVLAIRLKQAEFAPAEAEEEVTDEEETDETAEDVTVEAETTEEAEVSDPEEADETADTEAVDAEAPEEIEAEDAVVTEETEEITADDAEDLTAAEEIPAEEVTDAEEAAEIPVEEIPAEDAPASEEIPAEIPVETEESTVVGE